MSDTIELIRDFQVQRVACLKARTRQGNATGALVRRYFGWSPEEDEVARAKIAARAAKIIKAVEKGKFDKLSPQDMDIARELSTFILAAALARKPFDDMISSIEKEMVSLVKTLPVYPRVESVRGFGAVGLATIIGEAGDLHNYSSHQKLWKRLGLAVIDGNRQGSPGKSATAEDWIEHGYCPRRRSVIWNIGDPLIKQGTFYRDLYLKRKEYEAETSPELTKMQHHRRAQRYMEKMLLKHLWQAWRR